MFNFIKKYINKKIDNKKVIHEESDSDKLAKILKYLLDNRPEITVINGDNYTCQFYMNDNLVVLEQLVFVTMSVSTNPWKVIIRNNTGEVIDWFTIDDILDTISNCIASMPKNNISGTNEFSHMLGKTIEDVEYNTTSDEFIKIKFNDGYNTFEIIFTAVSGPYASLQITEGS
ncbi:MAG: hypothetical protein [Caudoviricetes sp.]|nr:MAG: hypothetical protein [Caudoviricetes sp.]